MREPEAVAHEVARRCRFSTDRLLVEEWHAFVSGAGIDLAAVVADILTPATTAALPPEWHGDFDRTRAERWIEERADESPTLLVVDRATGDPVGLVILFELDDPSGDGVDLRLGYVIAESSWGKGMATELVAGLVEWAVASSQVASISGGVARDNVASSRVLEKCGFATAEDLGGRGNEEVYRIVLGPATGSDAGG